MLALRVFVGLVVFVVACGPSRKKITAEQDAHIDLFEFLIETQRGLHACDAQVETMKSEAAAMDLAVSLQDGSYERHKDAAMRASGEAKTCIAMRPSANEVSTKMQRLLDAWVDCCLECASGKACIAAHRQFERETMKDFGTGKTEELKQRYESLKEKSVCSRGGT